MKRRWYKRCGADFIEGTMMLTLEEKGAYSLCLDLIYDRGAPIVDDARWLAGVCGVSIRRWTAIRNRLLELGKLHLEGGLLSNSRADNELDSSELSSGKRAFNSELSSGKRPFNSKKNRRNSAENEVTSPEFNDLTPVEKRREDKRREDVEATPQCARARPQPVAEAVEIWNEAARAVGWPLPSKLTDARRAAISNRLKEHGLDGWRLTVEKARSSEWLGGRDPPRFFAIDWFARATNFLKVREGNYDRNGTGQSRSAAADAYLAGGDLAGIGGQRNPR